MALDRKHEFVFGSNNNETHVHTLYYKYSPLNFSTFCSGTAWN